MLESGSTIVIFCKRYLLEKISAAEKGMRVYHIGDYTFTYKIGIIKGLVEAWLNPNMIANIMYIKEVTKVLNMNYKSKTNRGILILKPDQHNVILRHNRQGLYIHDTVKQKLVVINIVEYNLEGFMSVSTSGKQKNEGPMVRNYSHQQRLQTHVTFSPSVT